MSNEKKQNYIDIYQAAELLHDQQYIDDIRYDEIEHNLLYTIIGGFALELKKQGENT